MRPPVLLSVEAAAARAAGRLSRLAGRGGGTTLPGKLLWKLDPGAVNQLGDRLSSGSALISATNGKTTTAAMAQAVLAPRVRLAHNDSGANLVSGVASALLQADGAELGLFEVDEAALPEVAARLRPRVVCLGNLFRDQLDRYGELEHVAAGWRTTVAGLDAGSTLVVNA
ncbi:MAG: Mur ligase family protein, partial [Gaiellaceae bacterium]